ncbi:MAG TPA: hypothetical protein GX010_03490 [Erysipelotrichaceae bacterium]|nr:hypothetical protein [Erysipelotrichaceae bacterium]
MSKLFKAFMFKLTKDLTFKIVLIVGTVLAVATAIIFLIIDRTVGAELSPPGEQFRFCSGQSMLLFSLSPAQNFGIAIPINLAIFVVLEFTQGTIRNKVIVGHSKFKIYLSTFLSSLIFAFSIMLVYVGLCFILGAIIGGFNPDALAFSSSGIAYINKDFLVRIVSVTLFSYFAIVSFTTFIATLFRSIGPCIPVIVVVILSLSTLSIFTTTPLFIMDGSEDTALYEAMTSFSKSFNPLHAACGYEMDYKETLVFVPEINDYVTDYEAYFVIKDNVFLYSFINNMYYGIVFFVVGAIAFCKRDIK